MKPVYKVKKINGKTVYVHRIKMEKKLGRKLLRSEFVHHKNGNGSDNRLCNLEVVNRSEHAFAHMKMGWVPPIGGVTSTSFKKGSKNPKAKLSESIVRKIKREYKKHKLSVIQMSRKYSHIPYKCLYEILTERNWSYVN